MSSLAERGIIQVDPNNLPSKQLEQLAKGYAEVFADEPWGEFMKCSGQGCTEYFGREVEGSEVCPCPRAQTLVEFYPPAETMDYIRGEAAHPGSVMFLKTSDNETVGFVWGYKYATPKEFAESKYDSTTMQETISNVLSKEGITNEFFYYSEIGVRKDQRGKGISNDLSAALLNEASNNELPTVVRTMWDSNLIFVLDTLGAKQIMGPNIEMIQDKETGKRSINKVDGLVNNTQDTENEDRVLFILPPKTEVILLNKSGSQIPNSQEINPA